MPREPWGGCIVPCATRIGAGATRGGYLYFRATTYRNARVTLIDIESEEPEGFSIGF